MARPVALVPKAPREPAVTEEWAAQCFADTHKDRLAYCWSHKSWFSFENGIWRQKEKPVTFHYIRELAREMSIGASNAKTLQTARFCGSVETFAKNDPIFARTATEWDKDIWLAGTDAGAVDLRTGAVFAPRPSDMITKTLGVAPADHEDCPLWKQFLEEATGNDLELIRFLKQICGQILTGDISDQCLFFLFGDGGNGKGVFLSTIQGIMGDYSVVAPMETFEKTKFTRNTADLAMMRGARLVSSSETKEGAEWNEQRITAMTGGDKITAQYLYANPFTYLPQFTLLIIGNHQPALNTVNEAMRRRLNMIPFVIKPKRKDPHLLDKLRPEWPAILRWMINGCLDWQKNGFVRSQSVLNETAKYFEDQNVIKEWIDTACDIEMGNPYICETPTKLFDNWKSFARNNGVEPGNSKTFKPALERLGFKYHRTGSGRTFQFIKLKDRERTRDQDDDPFQ